jgi:aryl-alcohol dehydrogenase-like predicted oxidoreductase
VLFISVSNSWVLRRSEVTSDIVGARSPSQIEETTTVVPLTETDDNEIEAYLLERDSSIKKLI